MKKLFQLIVFSQMLFMPLHSLEIKEELKYENFLFTADLKEDDWVTITHYLLGDRDFETCLWNEKTKQKLHLIYSVLEKDKEINYASASSYLYSIFSHPEFKSSFEVMKKIYEESKKNNPYLTFKLHEVISEDDLIFEKKAHALGPYESHHDMIRIMKFDNRFLIIKLSQEKHFTKEDKETAITTLRDADVSFDG